MTEEEIERREEMIFAVYGWMLSSVELGDDTGWSYTQGLAENFDHPDLLVLEGPPLSMQIKAVRWLANAIVEGCDDVDAFAASGLLRLESVDVLTLPPDTLNGWADRYGRLPFPDEMVRLVLPDEIPACSCPRCEQ